MIQVDAARPDLSLMDTSNALAEAFQSLLLGENAPSPGAKALQNLVGLGGVQQDDSFDPGPECAHLKQHLSSVARLVVQIMTDDRDIDRHASDRGQQFLGIRGRSHDLEATIVAQSVGQELSVDASAVGNYDTDKVRAEILVGWHRAS